MPGTGTSPAHANLDLPDGLEPRSFVPEVTDPLVDLNGHGTHVAGIIAGGLAEGEQATAVGWYLDAQGGEQRQALPVPGISGMAPARQAAVVHGAAPRSHRRPDRPARRAAVHPAAQRRRTAPARARREHLGGAHVRPALVRRRADPGVPRGRPAGRLRGGGRRRGGQHRLRLREGPGGSHDAPRVRDDDQRPGQRRSGRSRSGPPRRRRTARGCRSSPPRARPGTAG